MSVMPFDKSAAVTCIPIELVPAIGGGVAVFAARNGPTERCCWSIFFSVRKDRKCSWICSTTGRSGAWDRLQTLVPGRGFHRLRNTTRAMNRWQRPFTGICAPNGAELPKVHGPGSEH